MRPASSRVLTLSISVLCLLATLFSLSGLASAQAAAGSKHKLSQQSLLSAHPMAGMVAAKKAAQKAPPPLTGDTWNGLAGDSQWTTAGNWSAGVPSSSNAVTIGTASATVSLAASQTGSFGTLTLSNSGDSVTVDNNAFFEAFGNISNAGTLTLSATGNSTQLYLENSLTLSGGGTVNLNSTNGQYTGFIDGIAGSVLTTSSNITGAGTVANGALNLVNSGTINANISGQTLTVNPDICTGCTNTNSGTLEATGGGTLNLVNGTWTQSGAGKITAAAGSTVNLETNVSIAGGTLSTTGNGVINDAASNDIFLTNVTNTGNFTVQNNGATEINGTLTNTGTITLAASGNVTELYLNGNTTLSGSGTVVLSTTNNQWTGYIQGVSGSVLTNQSTITGWGTIGNGALQIANASNGVINSNIAGGNILVNPLATVTSTNAGLMEATNTGTLTLSGGAWTNTGTIEAVGTNSSVVLNNNVSIAGGTLQSTGGGAVINAASNNVFLTGLTLAGTYDVQNNAATEINGTITNNGVINLQSSGNLTELYVTSAGTGTATLAGSGSIVLGTGTNNAFNGAGGTSLIIDQNVSGVGNIGEGALTLTNNSTINANISPTVSSQPLIIQPSAGGMANNGILEATNGGNLTLTGSTFTNASGGIIQAVGTDSGSNPSTVVLTGGVTVIGGTLTTSGAGIIEVAGSNIANLTNLTNNGTLNVLNNGQIDSTGTITNNGTITLEASGNQTYFYSPNATILTGTGTLVMSSPNGEYTANVQTTAGLTNDETITGAGTLGNGTFVNNGTVNANVSGQTLLMQSLSAATNTKTLEASGGGQLEFNGSAWTNTGGTITALANSAVELTGGVSITGGTLSTSGTGSQIYVTGSNVANLTGLTINGTMNVQNNGQIVSAGTITNNGTITLQAAGNQTYFYAPTATTLTGTGTLVLGTNGGAYTANVDAQGGLTNAETITGAGQIDTGSFTNNGTVNANVSNQTLLLQSFSAATNTKTMEATNGGTMEFNGSSWTNTGGTISAATGSAVELTGSTTITGGTLTSSGTGQIFVPTSSFAFLSGLTNSSTLNVNNNAQLQLTGAITNTGTINILGEGNTTYLLINGAVTLNGSGTIVLGGLDFTDAIYGVGTTPTLVSFNTIEGAGNIGSSNMGFTNNGTLNANVSGLNLAINVDASGFTNYNGISHTLTGGTYIANGGNITFASGGTTGITTLSAKVTEENGGQILDTSNSNANALANLTSITSTGALTIGGVAFTDAGSFSNAGSLTILAGESFTVGSLAQISAGSLTAGTYVLDANLNLSGAAQTITTNATNLTLAGGTIHNNTGGTNALAGLSTNTGKLTIAGTSNSVSSTAASFNNTGTLTINSSDSFSVGNLTQISGSTLSAGTYVLGGNLDLTTTGINITTNSATLTLEGGTIKSGTANALAALAANTKSLTIAGSGNNVSTTAASFSNTGTLTINAGDSFTAATLTQLNGANNNKTLTAGTYVLAGNLDLTTSGISITKNNTNLTLEGGTIESGSSNALSALATNSGKLTIAGTGTLVATSAASFSNTGTLTINAGDTFSAPALTQISGTTLSGGTFVLAGNLDLTAAANITTNSSVLTLEGGTIQTGTTNDLANLSSNTNSLTLASNANFSTVGSFTNSGALTINKGSKFTVSTGTLTNLSGGTLASGTYTIGGTLQLPTANGGITTNAANLTLTGTAAKIMDGTANALSGFKTNTGTFTLAGNANLTTATTANFTNSGTVTVSKGSKLTVGGSNHNYNQTAGTTTVDGTLQATNITATGGSIFGAGTLTGNTSVGNATGAAATLNVGDSGKAGLLAITGTYTQLATGTMNVSIGGLTTGTYSALSVSGNTSLGGTLTAAIVNGLVLTSSNIGQTFTILTTTGSLSGSFTNGTVTSGTDVFTVSYTGNSVVLTLTSVTGPGTKSQSAPAAAAMVTTTKPASGNNPVLRSVRGVGASNHLAKPILVAGLEKPSRHSSAILARGTEMNGLRSWEHGPVTPVSIRPIAVAKVAGAMNTGSLHNNVATPNRWVGGNQTINTPSTLAGWMGNSNRRVPVKIMPPSLPRMSR